MNTQIRRKQDGDPNRYGTASHVCDVSAETLYAELVRDVSGPGQ